MVNNLKNLEEAHEAPPELKKKVRKNVQTNLSIVKFVGNMFELYIGNAGRVVTEMLGTFEEKDEVDPPDQPLLASNASKPEEQA